MQILFEHPWFLVINKPVDLLSQAIDGIDSVETELLTQLASLTPGDAKPFVGLPHRLDRVALFWDRDRTTDWTRVAFAWLAQALSTTSTVSLGRDSSFKKAASGDDMVCASSGVLLGIVR